ncbi:hypothetical protein [Actinacidiphila paucisporea]|uniref:Transmembrane protein n=1 Tax=Actinacidiphila paucisporea TaxID=310782 RepID=A0A1M7CH17_9ACTN|nr:hypothetical protein [Actinacidiphila paucisporea]SHL66558.1 hypothetical protein SAMN05216499_105238 [Actinacidiphila paucisporea]
MTTAPHLLNEDRPDFEHVLDEALRIVLDDEGPQGPGLPDGAAGGGLPLNAEQLRTLALAAAERISAQAAAEYDAYRTLRAETREAVREAARSRDSRAFGYAAMGVADGAGSGAGLAAVIAVLTPLLAGAAALIFLLIGYSMAAVHPQPAIASPLRTAGWFFAAVAAAAILLGGIGLLLTALRDGSGAIHDSPDGMPPEVLRAREAWHQALLERGLLPFLEDALSDTAAPAAPAQAPSAPRMPRLGYSRPDFSSPQDPRPTAPRFSSPDFSSPDFGSPDFGGPDHAPE